MRLLKRIHVPAARAIAVFVATMALWVASIRFDLFERFHAYSRAHEDWELDEIAMLVLCSALTMGIALVLNWLRLIRAIRDRDNARRTAERHATHDPLTGLANRRYFQSWVKGLSARGEAVKRVMAIVDLQGFKAVNDLHGHAIGDAVLSRVAERLTTELGQEGMIARLGGDEFGIVFAENLDPDEAVRLARRILTRIQTPIEIGELSVSIDASVGLARPATVSLTKDGLEWVDRALHTARRAGRGQLAWYDAELDLQSSKRAALEADLRAAIRKGEVVPYFQPVFRLETGDLKGFEVLARWYRPEGGSVPPDIFIRVAEDMGLIGDLGESILRQACNHAIGWPSHLKIAVNVSPEQILDGNLVQSMRRILSETGFPPGRLEIEITETVVIQDIDLADSAIRELQKLGIAVALDDFGTGFSSLSTLRSLPFDLLKIDRSFITGVARDASNQEIVGGIMSLAHGLRLQVIAEGIETQADRDFVNGLGCEFGQGFFFEKALPAEHVGWLLETTWYVDTTPEEEPGSRQNIA